MKTFYEQLEVSQQADAAEIKQAYRKLSKQYHPDVNQGSGQAEERFKEIQKAYQVLSHEKTRREYDQKLTASSTASGRGHQAAGTNSSRTSADRGVQVDMESLRKQFANRFGFDPSNQEANKKTTDSKQKDPINSSAMFKHFFDV